MVSRLLASLSGILSTAATEPEEPAKEDAKNKNEKALPQSTDEAKESARLLFLEKLSNSTRSDFDLQFVTAESLDRAIVNRLQSRLNASVADAFEERPSESRVKMRCENSPVNVSSKLSNKNIPAAQIKEQTHEETKTVDFAPTKRDIVNGKMSAPEIPRPRSRASTVHKESVSQSSVMSHDIPGANSPFTHATKKVQESGETSCLLEFQPGEALAPAGEPRSLVFKNAQFNLENSSKEALFSNSSKRISESDHQSYNIPQLPEFEISNSLHHRHRSPLTSSTESIMGSDTKATDTDEEGISKQRKRSRSHSPVLGRSFLCAHISATHIGDHVLESAINEIIERGGDEFRNKYSSWIWDAFRVQLEKLKGLMLAEFNEKLRDLLQEKEHDVSELQRRYRDKIVESDVTTESYQKLVDDLYTENQRLLTAKDFIIDKLKKEFLEIKKHFEQDFQRKMQSYRKEAEVERMELQKRNDELLLVMLTDGSKCGLEQAFKNEIESLRKMIKTLTTQNETLHQQLDEATNDGSAMSRKTVENLESQLDNATVEIIELRKKLQFMESEKQDLTVSHHQEIAKLNRKIQESNTRYDHQLRDAAEEIAAMHKKHSRDVKELKVRLATQEAQHSVIMSQVRQQYGTQVESLSDAVTQLRSDLTGTNARLLHSSM